AVSIKYMGLTGRWTDKDNRKGYWHSLSGVEAMIETAHQLIRTIRIPDVSLSVSSANPSQFVSTLQAGQVIDKVLVQINAAHQRINALTPIKGKVSGLIHKFVESIYYERLFSGMAESVFEQYKSNVDMLLAGRCA